MDRELKDILKKSTLLLVEDDFRIREKFSRLLNIYVDKIYEAHNGKKALELYEKYNPSFVITDIEMPDMTGLELIDILKQENPYLIVVITSAFSNKEYLINSIKLQVSDYLIKPINNSELQKTLEKIAITIKEKIILGTERLTKDIEYDFIKKRAYIQGNIVHLTPIESKFLEILIFNKGMVVTKSMLEDKIYTFDEMSNVALKNIVYKIRKKLVKDLIISVDRLGYMINKEYTC